MLQYIVRRIFIMIPTLLGISLVTLAMVHLAPGDPVQAQLEGTLGKGTITPEEIEALRRTYALHLPVFLNLTPEDANVVNAKLIEEVTSPEERKRTRALRRLSTRGGVVLEPAVKALRASPPDVQASLLTGLEPVARRMGYEAELAEAPDKVAFWEEQLKKLPPQPYQAAEAAVSQLIANPTGERPAALKQLDTFALPALFAALRKTDSSSPVAMALTEELTRISGVDNTIHEGDSVQKRKDLVDSWRIWWTPRRADFVVFSGAERVSAFVSETQYFKWLKRLFTLDFDRSSRDNVPIRQKLGERLKVTLTLAMLSLMVAYIIAIPLGVFSAVKQYTLADRLSTVVLFMLYSLPSFWVAMLLQQYLCGASPEGLDLFPLVGLFSPDFDQMTLGQKIADMAWHLVLPVTVLTYASFASLSRFQRVGMLDIIRQDFIRTARAKGLPERVVIMKHALRNSVLPIVTLLGMHLPALVGGAVIVESIFNINGMGLETLEAIRTRDMNWIMASVTLTALMTMAGILLSDVLYALVDPRIQVGNRDAA